MTSIPAGADGPPPSRAADDRGGAGTATAPARRRRGAESSGRPEDPFARIPAPSESVVPGAPPASEPDRPAPGERWVPSAEKVVWDWPRLEDRLVEEMG